MNQDRRRMDDQRGHCAKLERNRIVVTIRQRETKTDKK